MGQISFRQIFKVVAVFFLGYTVYSTERAIRHKQARRQFRRSATINNNQNASASFKIQQESKPSQADYERVYIVKVEPKEVVFPQNEQERQEYEETFSKSNYTKYQFPDYVNVPLDELPVVYYNGMSFYRQGVKNSPEYDLSLTGANTRSRKEGRCPGKPKSAKKEKPEQEEPEEFSPRNGMLLDTGIIAEEPEEKEAVQQIGCCNGMPYNTNKRCCCRRASFNKDEKFCCAIDGCGDFKILKKSLENYDLCYSLSGMVVQEYGYHKMAGARDMGFMKKN